MFIYEMGKVFFEEPEMSGRDKLNLDLTRNKTKKGSYWENAKSYVSEKSKGFDNFSLKDYASEKWEGLKGSETINYIAESKPWKYAKKNYLSGPDVKKAFSKKAIDSEGMQSTLQYAAYGLGAVALKGASTLYARTPEWRETASNMISYLPDFWNIESNFRSYLTMGGFQNNVMPEINKVLPDVLNLSPGSVTTAIAAGGLILTGLSLGYLNEKRKERKKKAAGGEPLERLNIKSDIGNVLTNSPLTAVTLAAGIPGYIATSIAGKAGVATAAVSSVFKIVNDHNPATKNNSFFSKMERKLNDWYNGY